MSKKVRKRGTKKLYKHINLDRSPCSALLNNQHFQNFDEQNKNINVLRFNKNQFRYYVHFKLTFSLLILRSENKFMNLIYNIRKNATERYIFIQFSGSELQD